MRRPFLPARMLQAGAISVGILAGPAVAPRPAQAQQQDAEITVQISPITLDMEGKGGKRVTRTGLKAVRPAPPSTSEQALITNAERIFEQQLRRRTEQAKGDLAAVIYDLGPTTERGTQGTRIYSVLFVRDGGAWTKLNKTPPAKP
jgi:hypothetical protein